MTIRSFRSKALLFIATMAVVFSPVFYAPLPAQGTALTKTTLSSAVAANDAVINVTSATGFTVGYFVWVDRELMKVSVVTSTQITVTRAQGGTGQAAHVSGSVVFVGPASGFKQTDPLGSLPCTTAGQPYLPWINVATGNRFMCDPTSLVWYREFTSGFSQYSQATLAGLGASTMTYTAAGAITVRPGTQFINGTTLAMTLVDPTTSQNGMVMTLISTNASAQTITYTAGFNGGTTARDVATFGGAVGDNIVIQAVNGVWWVISTRNVTLA